MGWLEFFPVYPLHHRAIKVLLLTHDVSDPATLRRVAILKAGGCEIAVAGFRRSASPIPILSGCPVTDLGRTSNGQFIRRILSVLRIVATANRHKDMFADADIILARNLEMLAVAVRGRRFAGKYPAVIYEVLDIHRLLLRKDIIGTVLRRLEGWLSSSCAAVITSSPAFIKNYFDKISHVKLPIRLVENKLIDTDNNLPVPSEMPECNHPPWRIGWFGNLRCRKSLTLLRGLAHRSEGRIEVIIRGRPSLDQMDNFHEIVTTTAGMKFLGPYQNPQGLASIYSDIDFVWAIDMFEEGLNSSWLLPNRLYEGCYFGAVPLALSGVETGDFLQRHNIGVILTQPLEGEISTFFAELTTDRYATLKRNVMNMPKSTWIYDQSECADFNIWLQDFLWDQGIK